MSCRVTPGLRIAETLCRQSCCPDCRLARHPPAAPGRSPAPAQSPHAVAPHPRACWVVYKPGRLTRLGRAETSKKSTGPQRSRKPKNNLGPSLKNGIRNTRWLVNPGKITGTMLSRSLLIPRKSERLSTPQMLLNRSICRSEKSWKTKPPFQATRP